MVENMVKQEGDMKGSK